MSHPKQFTRFPRASSMVTGVVAVVAMTFPAGIASGDLQSEINDNIIEFLEVGRTAVPRAECGPGSLPEAGLQGDVPAAERDNGRSTLGYRCNMSLVGQQSGIGAGIVSAGFENCSYEGTVALGAWLHDPDGVRVIDASDPTNPVVTATLSEPAMSAGTWETLKVNPARKLLAGLSSPAPVGAGYFSVYDISDCAHPRLLNPGPGTNLAQPLPVLTHEGGFSPDGNTFWSSGIVPGSLSAIDISDPSNPHVIWQGITGIMGHGFGISPDGNRMYLAAAAGFTVLDISDVQNRRPKPNVRHIGRVFWSDGQATQHAIPVTYNGRPYVYTADEAGEGGVKLIDLSDETDPKLVNRVKLEINLPENQDRMLASAMGGASFGYDSHYCTADRIDDPTALACGWIQSGVRVFDIRDPENIREIAYYNPPARTGQNLQTLNSPHSLTSFSGAPLVDTAPVLRSILEGTFDPMKALSPRSGDILSADLSTDWCMSPPEWRGDRLYVSCSDNGFMVLQLDNNVYTPPSNQNSTLGTSLR
ncbi:LVIVD repeat-containing protein [Nocardia brasiliensis]|uniref:LVIVD repeat-containing protein n=1 Tax=Nocardia brasiliensis TaxID=37326 RepID=UPI003D8A50B2